jgi:hypothetical protein
MKKAFEVQIEKYISLYSFIRVRSLMRIKMYN